MWCEIRLDGNDKLLIGCVYRSPSSTNANNSQLQELILKAYRRNPSHLLIVGDFNYPEINWVSWTSSIVSQHSSKDLIDTLQDNFLFQLVDKPTRYREGQKPSLLDLIITNEENFINDIEYCSPLGKSDHLVLQFDMICCIEYIEGETQGRYIYNKGDYKKLIEDLSKIDWKREIEELNWWQLAKMKKSIPDMSLS